MKFTTRLLTSFLVMAALTMFLGVVSYASVSYGAAGRIEASGTQVRAVATSGSAYDERGMPAYGYLHAKITTSLQTKSAVGSRFSGSTTTPVRTSYADKSANESGVGSYWTSGS